MATLFRHPLCLTSIRGSRIKAGGLSIAFKLGSICDTLFDRWISHCMQSFQCQVATKVWKIDFNDKEHECGWITGQFKRLFSTLIRRWVHVMLYRAHVTKLNYSLYLVTCAIRLCTDNGAPCIGFTTMEQSWNGITAIKGTRFKATSMGIFQLRAHFIFWRISLFTFKILWWCHKPLLSTVLTGLRHTFHKIHDIGFTQLYHVTGGELIWNWNKALYKSASWDLYWLYVLPRYQALRR